MCNIHIHSYSLLNSFGFPCYTIELKERNFASYVLRVADANKLYNSIHNLRAKLTCPADRFTSYKIINVLLVK